MLHFKRVPSSGIIFHKHSLFHTAEDYNSIRMYNTPILYLKCLRHLTPQVSNKHIPQIVNVRESSSDCLTINFIFEMIRVLAYPWCFAYLFSMSLIHHPLACCVCFLQSKGCPIVLVCGLYDHEFHLFLIRYVPSIRMYLG